MKLLITGALGHIGSGLIHSIKPGKFDRVILVDNLMTQRYASLFNLPKGVPFEFYNRDIRDIKLNRLLKGIDVVIHLAAITDATTSFKKRGDIESINYKATKRLAEACAVNECRLMFLSTTSVYGSQSKVVDETCPESELKPQSPYAESKLKAEKMLLRMVGRSDLKVMIGRMGTIFGPSVGMRFHTAVNKFIWQAVLNQPLSVWRTAMHQKRPYLDLRDAVSAMMHVIDNDLFNGEVYNVATTNVTVSEIVAGIKKYVPDTGVKYVDSPIMNQLSYEVSGDKFKATGFSFKGNLRVGVKKTIDMLKNMRSR